jgi:hypothetical protein
MVRLYDNRLAILFSLSQSANSREQFVDREGLAKIVISADSDRAPDP